LLQVIVCLLSWILVVGPQSTPPDSMDARLALFGRYVEALRRQLGMPGLSAVVVRDGKIVWEAGFGFQDVDRRVPATVDTPYRIASLTKTFTSVLLLQCVERGTLDLDTPIRQYTSAIPEPGATVRHVFTHTSEGVPGQIYRYNGDRYGALTAVVEACWGAPFRQIIAHQILDRLAMQDSVPGQDLENPDDSATTLFDPTALARYRDVLLRIALPYKIDSRGRATVSSYPPRGINAAAGLVSTARDLALYDAALSAHALLRSETQEAAWTRFRNNSGQEIPYGLGWFVQALDGERVVWHYGLWGNSFSSLILKVPSRQLTLILLANSDGLSARFPMAAGDITVSPFASAFLRIVK
jgi:CubicO group peptidase (beta-lactamase class C family)